MKTQDFIKAIEDSYTEAIGIVKKKNADYATTSDPFRNFRYANYCNVSVEKAILVRISDKFARVCNLIEKGGDKREVVEEKVTDTLLDMSNYLMILKTYMENKK